MELAIYMITGFLLGLYAMIMLSDPAPKKAWHTTIKDNTTLYVITGVQLPSGEVEWDDSGEGWDDGFP